MNLISQILDPARIRVDVAASERDGLFAAIGELCERDSGLAARKLVDALNQREKLGSTGLGMGIAIPHQRIKGLKEPLGAFLRTASPIPFDAPDGLPVSLFFVMLAPEQANETHLRLLAELAQMFSDKGFRDALLSAPDSAAIAAAFQNWSLHAASERSSAV
ncbi:PTS sugar transporter subunit IIA [Uliginosibacterium aquaticum]|uniref:PTS sugar transporter subunit IIA n=1 Tax=Uliginosibacterium aquaticum TaxID=2731212 RepID=A0ABX2IHC1_9RHOO|nr:PTS sugar transporter subunit IIA [Uliginosibacterium aquaticum]NSL56159.1 PTS sugar transporter subunit IIA [Uliginosibacterium aquaticum]